MGFYCYMQTLKECYLFVFNSLDSWSLAFFPIEGLNIHNLKTTSDSFRILSRGTLRNRNPINRLKRFCQIRQNNFIYLYQDKWIGDIIYVKKKKLYDSCILHTLNLLPNPSTFHSKAKGLYNPKRITYEYVYCVCADLISFTCKILRLINKAPPLLLLIYRKNFNADSVKPIQ